MANVPIQSLIDHIKTAIDVDPWAKEMAEELLKKQEPKLVRIKTNAYGTKHYYCPKCNEWFEKKEPYCHLCGQAVKWE